MKRPRGFRLITVGGQALFWQFRPGPRPSELVVVAGGGRLVVRLADWQDPWLSISDVHERDGVLSFGTTSPNEPAVVGPAFVRSAIDWALARGWRPLARAPDLLVVFRGGEFAVG